MTETRRGEVALRRGDERTVLYRPTEQQELLHASPAENILYGGAAGGGKSMALRWHGINRCHGVPNFRALLLRRQFTDLEKDHILALRQELPDAVGTYKGNKQRVEFDNGSILQFGHAETMEDFKSWLSTEWELIMVDEAVNMLPKMLTMLPSRLRTTKDGVIPQYILASNPGGPSHQWLKKRFIDKEVPAEEDPTYDPADYEFIPSKVQHNPHLSNRYENRLRALPEKERAAYLEGDWSTFSGQFFSEWADEIHVVTARDQFEIPVWWERIAGMDWGYAPSPGVVEIAAVDPHDRLWVYKELKFKRMSARRVADALVELCDGPREQAMTIYGDTQMWTPQSSRQGASIAEDINDRLADHDVSMVLEQATKDRINGWMRIHQYLDPDRKLPDGGFGPYLRVFEDRPGSKLGCPYLISTLPNQVYDEDEDGDMAGSGDDHACDALRYLCMERPPLTEVPLAEKDAPTHESRVRKRTKELMEKADEREGRDIRQRVADPIGEALGHPGAGRDPVEDLWS